MKYQITIIVEDTDVGPAITAVQPFLRVPLQLTPVSEEPARPKREARGDAPAHTTRCGQRALEALRTGPITLPEVSAYLHQHGFSANSASPILSKLIQEGLVARTRTSLNGVQTKLYALSRPLGAASA